MKNKLFHLISFATFFLAILFITVLSSKQTQTTELPTKITEIPVVQTERHEFKTVVYYKHIKDLKEISETKTSYKYKFNFWKGDFYHQPDIHTLTTYYVIYTDHTKDEVSKNTWLTYSKGDSVAFTKQIMIN